MLKHKLPTPGSRLPTTRLLLLIPLLIVLGACGVPGPPTQPTMTAVAVQTQGSVSVANASTAGAAATTPPVIPPTTPPSLVYLRPVAASASSFDNTPGFAPTANAMNAADGDFGTRWAPQNGLDNQWIYFDLGQKKTITEIRIFWEAAFATAYDLQISDDAQNWQTAIHLEKQDGGTDDTQLAPQQARYIRMLADQRKFPAWGTSIWEFEIYGPAAANPGDKPYSEVYKPKPSPTAASLETPIAGKGAWGETMQAGVNYTSWSQLEYLGAESDQTLSYLATNGVNAIAIVPTWYQDNLGATDIKPESGSGGRTPSDAAVIHAINLAHKLGMRVMLKPHLDLETTDSRGAINNPAAAWYASYTSFIKHYAAIAQTYNIELFCVGTELDGTALNHDSDWRDIISAVRGVYGGQLTYAANWPSYAMVPFWNDLDFIGIDAYFHVTDSPDPTADQLLTGWRGIANTLNGWRAGANLNKPLIFTELGYPSIAGSNMEFGAPNSNTSAPEQQAAVLKTALTVMREQPWFRGVYYWNYLPAANPNDPLGFTVRGKPAEQVLFDAFRSWAR